MKDLLFQAPELFAREFQADGVRAERLKAPLPARLQYQQVSRSPTV